MERSKNMEKFKSLTPRQKIGFIRDYYTLHIIAAILVIAAVGWSLNNFIFNPPPRTFINISFYGQFIPEELRTILSEELTYILVKEGGNYTVIVDNFFSTGDMQFDLVMSQRMVAMVTARELDVLVISPGEADDFVNAGFARDLGDMLSADKISQLDDIGHFAFFSNFGQQFGGSFEGWRLIALSNSEREEAVRAFFDYILFFHD